MGEKPPRAWVPSGAEVWHLPVPALPGQALPFLRAEAGQQGSVLAQSLGGGTGEPDRAAVGRWGLQPAAGFLFGDEESAGSPAREHCTDRHFPRQKLLSHREQLRDCVGSALEPCGQSPPGWGQGDVTPAQGLALLRVPPPRAVGREPGASPPPGEGRGWVVPDPGTVLLVCGFRLGSPQHL